MSRLSQVLGLLCVLLLAGCGGSSSSSSTATSTTQPAGAATSTASTTTASTTTTTSSTGTTAASPTSTTTPRPARGSKKSPPAPKGARVPATFEITAGGSLSPPTISSPAGFTVAMTLKNRDTKAHTAVIRTPNPSAPIHVPVGGYAYLLESKLPKGTYPITIDGAPRGALVIGSSPGP